MKLSDKLEPLPAVVCAQVHRSFRNSPSSIPAKTSATRVDKKVKKGTWITCHTKVILRAGPLPPLSKWSMFPEISLDASEWIIAPPPSATANRRRYTSSFIFWKKQRRAASKTGIFGFLAPLSVRHWKGRRQSFPRLGSLRGGRVCARANRADVQAPCERAPARWKIPPAWKPMKNVIAMRQPYWEKHDKTA